MADYSRRDPVKVSEHVQRRTQALEMKAEGANYQQIADALNYCNRGAAWKDIQAGLDVLRKDEKEAAERLIILQRIRLEQLLQAWWPRATGQSVSNGGKLDGRAADIVLKVMERQASLEGLNAPTKIDATLTQNVDERITQLMALLGIESKSAHQVIPGELEELEG